jgi:TrmH family RNA methyltransferase
MSFAIPTKNNVKQFSAVLDKKFRQTHRLFQIEGIHLFEEFLKSSLEAEWIVVDSDFTNKHPQLTTLLKKQFPKITFQATPPDFKKLSDTEHSQGVVAAIRQGRQDPNSLYDSTKKEVIVALDGIADPGNLGTILRSAEWFGVKKIILNASCVEVHNPKVVRASMGSLFRLLCFERMDLPKTIEKLKSNNYTIYAASANGEEISSTAAEKSVLVIGNEAHGISDKIRSDHKIGIRGSGKAESLNAAVACSILLYEFSRSMNR